MAGMLSVSMDGSCWSVGRREECTGDTLYNIGANAARMAKRRSLCKRDAAFWD
jgi:hypothetical protein